MTDRHPVTKTKRDIEREIKRYLRTGEHDHDFTGWPGNDYLSRVTAGKQAMKDSLVVRRLEHHPVPTRGLDEADRAQHNDG